MTAGSVLTPERVLRRLEWRVIRRLDGRMQGDYRTLFRGHGIDVADVREYTPGDEARHIDWNVTARMDTPYVREYLEDREVTAWLLLDRLAVDGVRPGRAAQARRGHRGGRHRRPTAGPRWQPGRRDAVRHRGERDDPARARAQPGAADHRPAARPARGHRRPPLATGPPGPPISASRCAPPSVSYVVGPWSWWSPTSLPARAGNVR